MVRPAQPLKTLLDRPPPERRLGPFMLVEQLGRGGFAPVWLAKEVYGATELRTAAVKLFALDNAGRGAGASATLGRSRIVEEARSLCQVEHPNVVRFYSLPIDERIGVMGLAMELVAGTPLDRKLMLRGTLTAVETIVVGVAIASALSAVHRAGLVHRDVKPANVVEASGIYKLIDFGIAAADELVATDAEPASDAAPARSIVEIDDLPIDVAAPSRTTSPEVTARGPEGARPTVSLKIRCGTVGFIDPHCVETGDAATPESDLYALGATLFECLTGKLPAAAASPARGLKLEILDGRAPAPSLLDLVPDIPPDLARLVALLLEPDPRKRPSSAEWVAIRLEQIRNALMGRKRALPPESEGPFRGLGRFKEADRDVYFGRTSEVAAALEMLRSRGLVALVGPSGSGKSSLARAGVLPAVAEGALGGWPKRWDTAIVEPGRDARASIVGALAPFVPQAADLGPEALAQALAERAQETEWGLLFLVDQLEELATIASEESRTWAATLLARLGEQAMPGVRTVVAARRDMLDPLLALGALGKVLVRGSVLIEPMSDPTWGEVLDQALEAYGYKLEDEALRAELMAELHGTASAMPLVQFALTELWQKRDVSRKRVTRAGLAAIGGIPGALERHADATLAVIGEARGGEDSARAVLLALTTPQGTRATKGREELLRAGGAGSEEVLGALEKARLVVPGAHGLTLAHEALLAQWGKLRSWVAEAREERLLAAELERDAAAWREDREAPLWQKRRLQAAEELHRLGVTGLSTDAIGFLKASRRAERRGKLLITGAVAIVALSILGGVAAYVRSVRVQEEATRVSLEKEQRALRATENALKTAEESRLEAENSRRAAEETTLKVLAQQTKIDELSKELATEQDKERRRDLRSKIRSLQDSQRVVADQAPSSSSRRTPEDPGRPATGNLPPFEDPLIPPSRSQ
ncbi:MAG: protein kinase [Byssovorax sp.]